MAIARIENGAVAEVRNIDLVDVPMHKRVDWRVVVDQPPVVDIRISSSVATGWNIGASEVTRVYDVVPHDRAIQIQSVKAECQRRIIAATGVTDLLNCLVKQMNMQMRAAEIINIKASGGVLTEQQVAEAAALQAIADRIKALRARSNEIEAINPIPSDFASDARWS